MAENLQAQLVEAAGDSARLAGKLAIIADTPLPARAPARTRVPKVAMPPLTAGASLGEGMAASLTAELARVFPPEVLTVRYAPPAILIDYLPLRLKLTVRHQHAIGALIQGPDEVMVEQSTGPLRMFRAKTGTPAEMVDYVVRFFKRLKAKPAEVPPEVSTGGKRRHARKVRRTKPTKHHSPSRRHAPSFAALVRNATRRLRRRRRSR